ncbi:MAG: hypothetical protein EXR18_08245 [Flavobacteriaceae bacterium]|nr:hypothetical protein [Flavobacteriaceae bacterium]
MDELTIHDDGSGTLKYAINLSSSRVKVNSILALDSLDGKKVPSIDEIKAKVLLFKKTLTLQNGISAVNVSENYTDFIFKFECNFTNIDLLQEGLRKSFSIISNDNKISESEFSWLSWDSKVLKRSIPSIATEKLQRITENDLALLKTGTYTSITRFDRPVVRFENPLSKLSKDKKALMLRTDTYSLKEKQSLLENTIYLFSN